MKIEIVHDLLAKSVFDAASAEDKARAKAEQLVKNRFGFYKSDDRFYLGEGELNFITPFFKELDLNTAEEAFVQKSKNRLQIQKNRLRLRNYVIIALVAIVICLPIGLMGWYNAYNQSRRAQTAQQEKEKTTDSLKIIRTEFNSLRKAAIGEDPTISTITSEEEDPLFPEERTKPVFKTIRFKGRVLDAKKRPIPYAKVELLKAVLETNRAGEFDAYLILPPYHYQQPELPIYVRTKRGGEKTAQFLPQAEQADIVIIVD